jgi:hypothetical protein
MRSARGQRDNAQFDAAGENRAMTAERERTGFNSKRRIMVGVQKCSGGRGKRAVTLDHPQAAHEKGPMPGGAPQLAGATQPLGKRTTFLGPRRSYLANPALTFAPPSGCSVSRAEISAACLLPCDLRRAPYLHP